MTIASTPQTFTPVQTYQPPLALSTCIRAVLVRNTGSMSLSEAQRGSNFPAHPFCSISCLFAGHTKRVASAVNADEAAPRPRLLGVTVTGPQERLQTVVHETQAHYVMVFFYPDAWWMLTGVSMSSLTNHEIDASMALHPEMLAACERMFAHGGDEAHIHHLFDYLQPLWQKCVSDHSHRGWTFKDWSQVLTPWMESLAMRAATTGLGRSLRQSERRIKHWTGTSLRKLQGSARREAVFFAVMDALSDEHFDWTQIAVANGFSDQSHFIRETRRITGFSPEALRHGVLNEEAFWLYRAWAKLAGYTLPGEVV